MQATMSTGKWPRRLASGPWRMTRWVAPPAANLAQGDGKPWNHSGLQQPTTSSSSSRHSCRRSLRLGHRSSRPYAAWASAPARLQVTGMAVDNVSAGYDFPAGATDGGGGGLVDVSAAAPSHCTGATPDMQRRVQEFFRQRQQQPEPEEQAPEAEASARTGEETGQG